MRRDLSKDILPEAAIDPVGNRTATVNGADHDLQGHDGAVAVIQVGTITDGTHTPKLEEADDDGNGAADTWSDVAAADIVGTLAALASDTLQWVAYKGAKRHLRVTVTVAGATTGGEYSAAVVKTHPAHAPTA